MIVAQFGLIIIISAAIAGTVGGVTSQINKWKASAFAVPKESMDDRRSVRSHHYH